MADSDILIGGERLSLRQFTRTMADIISDVSDEQSISEETAKACLLAALNLLRPVDESSVRTVLNLHKQI